MVYNIKSQKTRLVYMTPQRDWGGKGLIGVTIRLDDYAAADERLLRVLDVEPTSPADVAGLIPGHDYLLGTATVSFSSDAVLASILAQYEERPFEIYVYNTESDTVRIVTLLPTYEWGGAGGKADGLLGAEVGMGYLHRFPQACRETDGASVDVNVVRMTAPRRPHSTSGENEEECEESTEEEIIDLTREDEEDVGQEQQSPNTENASQGIAPVSEMELPAEAEEVEQQFHTTSVSATEHTQSSSNTNAQERKKEVGNSSQSAADFFTNHQSPPTTVESEEIEESSTPANAIKPVSNDSKASVSVATSEPTKTESSNLFRLRFPSIPFRSGTFTPPASASNASGAGTYFPPPPMSNLDIGPNASSAAVDSKTKMPPPPMFSRSVAPINKQEIDLR